VIVVLKPLGSLSRQIAQRPADELEPLGMADVPADVRPLVQAINEHMERIQALNAQQRAFLDDASHQLRTHLTTLRMQVDYARAEPAPPAVQAALQALGQELQRAARSTHQLLSLGRSDTAALEPTRFDVLALLQEVAREFLPAARAKDVDLGVEGAAHDATADRELLREALANLVANAIAYAPHGRVTLSSAEDRLGWSISVEDNGPGLPPAIAGRLGMRFLRGESRSGGSGLGLAIAQAIARRHAGVLRLEPGEHEQGLRATIWWPRRPDDPRSEET
jgi:two-component system sensor histidine kinase TctE